MKQYAAVLTALCLALCLTACGGGQTNTPQTSAPVGTPPAETSVPTPAPAADPYADVLARYETAVREDWDSSKLSEAGMSVLCADGCGTDAAGALGYLLRDLDGDGSDELLIGLQSDDSLLQELVFDLYTVKDGAAVQIFSGWERSRWYLEEDGLLVSEGSDSAFTSMWYVYQLSDGALKPVQAVVYDSAQDEAQPWRRFDGDWETVQGVPISEEEGQKLTADLEARFTVPEYTPFTGGQL